MSLRTADMDSSEPAPSVTGAATPEEAAAAIAAVLAVPSRAGSDTGIAQWRRQRVAALRRTGVEVSCGADSRGR